MARHAINRVFVLVVDLARHRYIAHGQLVRGLGVVCKVARHVTVFATNSERFIVTVHQTRYLA